MAERAGFEPARQLPTYTLSKRAPSASRTPLQNFLAEREGFEPPVQASWTAVFETAPFNRSGISPEKIVLKVRCTHLLKFRI